MLPEPDNDDPALRMMWFIGSIIILVMMMILVILMATGYIPFDWSVIWAMDQIGR